MIAILSTLFGVISGILPNLVKLMEIRTQNKHDLEMLKLQLDAQARGLEFQTITDEGKSLRDHDLYVSTGGYMELIRASIRPFITYFFFFLFCGIKITAATFMFHNGYNALEVLNAVWDSYTMAIFGSVMGFWFGSRAITKMSEDFATRNYKYPTQKVKPTPVPTKKGK